MNAHVRVLALASMTFAGVFASYHQSAVAHGNTTVGDYGLEIDFATEPTYAGAAERTRTLRVQERRARAFGGSLTTPVSNPECRRSPQ